MQQDMRSAALYGEVAIQGAGAVPVDGELAWPGYAADLYAGRLINGADAVGQIDRDVSAQIPVVDRLNRVANGTERGGAGRGIIRIDIQAERPGICLRHGIGDHLVRVQLLEAYVAVGRHLHEHVLVVRGVK